MRYAGSVAERLERWTCDSEAPSLSSTRTTARFVLGKPEFKFMAAGGFASYQLGFVTMLCAI